MQGKNTKFGKGCVGLNRRSSGRLGRGEVNVKLEEKSVVESSGCVWNSENKNQGTVSQNTTACEQVRRWACVGVRYCGGGSSAVGSVGIGVGGEGLDGELANDF